MCPALIQKENSTVILCNILRRRLFRTLCKTSVIQMLTVTAFEKLPVFFFFWGTIIANDDTTVLLKNVTALLEPLTALLEGQTAQLEKMSVKF